MITAVGASTSTTLPTDRPEGSEPDASISTGRGLLPRSEPRPAEQRHLRRVRADRDPLEVVSVQPDVGEEPGRVGMEVQERPGAPVEDAGGSLHQAADGAQFVEEGCDLM